MERAGRSVALSALFAAAGLLVAAAIALPAGTSAEQASQPSSPAAGYLDTSAGTADTSGSTCARLDAGVRCWGFGGSGRLGYGNTNTIGDDETPGSVGAVNLGSGRTAEAISVGGFHTCALLDRGDVRCWGFGDEGRLGYANRDDVGDDEDPGLSEPVDLGADRVAEALTAGQAHTCALLDGGDVRCWGFGEDGRLGYGDEPGYGDEMDIGDDEDPDESVGPVKLGTDRTATAISAGQSHTCALLDGGDVRCWGLGSDGRLGLGYRDVDGDGDGDVDPVGDNETPDSVDPVDLGPQRSAKAISAGAFHTCALLDDDTVRCWGFAGSGALGYGNDEPIGDDEDPDDSVGSVKLGAGATAISAGDNHTCALLDDGDVRCWGFGGDGRLGYGTRDTIGDDETPDSVGPIDLGPGRTAVAISAGGSHTCALLDDGSIRCWGDAFTGRLGYCNANDIGDDETPGSVGPVNVTGSSDCSAPDPPSDPIPPTPPPRATPKPKTGDGRAKRRRERYRRAFAAQTRRKRALRSCYARVGRHATRERREVRRRDSSRRRLRAKRHIARHRSRGRRACSRRHGRTPGRVKNLRARAVSRSEIVLNFPAPGTDRGRPPAAREYVVKQSSRPIRGRRGFRRARALCGGRCGFDVKFVGATIKLTVTDLKPGTTYHYSVAARDNVSGRSSQRSPTVQVRTQR